MTTHAKTRSVLSGNQAVARGFYEAGGAVAASYPGSPTVELMQTLIDEYGDVLYAEFSTNEKVALEVAMGASFAGARSLASMKHVGVNIAADPLMTFTQTEVKGGFLLVSGEDPGMASSQNEQDNRYLGRFARMAVLDPSDSQEAKDFTKLGLALSETHGLPVMLRITSRLCHSRSVVELSPRKALEIPGFEPDTARYCMLPPYTYEAQHRMARRIEALAKEAETMDINRLEKRPESRTLIVTSGICHQHLKEIGPHADIYKLGMVYPLPAETLKRLAQGYERVLVVEELMPFIEEELKLLGIPCEGKAHFSFTGELDLEDVARGLESAGIPMEADYSRARPAEPTVGRSPLFCAGCPHRPVFDILKKEKTLVIGDIGCYSLGILYPFEVLKTNISMGAGIGILKGMAKAHRMAGKEEPLAAVIGDGTLFHSGLPAFVNLLQNLEEENLTILVLDNRTTAMTGGQPTASSGAYRPGFGASVDLEGLLKAMGLPRVLTVDQFKYKEAAETIKAELGRPGLSIVITTRPCALTYKIRGTPYEVDPDVCIGCRSCVRTNCPPIRMKAYEGKEALKSSIDPTRCVGCSVCAQVCPVGAISPVGSKKEAKA